MPALGATGGKGAAAAPHVTQENATKADAGDEKLPLLDDVMQLARIGDVGAVQKLFDDGKIDSGFKDQEGITPLHVRHSATPPPGDANSCLVGSYQ